ncbi:MAG: metallophosphoesterase family protein [Candidatus Asgardarchaeia archaeon]
MNAKNEFIAVSFIFIICLAIPLGIASNAHYYNNFVARYIPSSVSINNATDENVIYNDTVLNILYPRNSIPEFVKIGQPFKIVVNATQSPSNWNVFIYSIKGSGFAQIENVTQDNNIWTIWCTVNNVPIGLYNLSVSAIIGDITYRDIEPRSINVIDAIPSSFKFVVINDFRISKKHPERETALIEAIKQINMIRPTFVLVIGDLVNSGFWEDENENDTAEQYRTFYNILQQFEVPTFLICGNHEYYNNGKKYYDKYFGYWPNQLSDDQYHNYTFVFGESVFVFVDTGEGSRAVVLKDSQVQWVESQFKKYQDKKLKFLVLHVPVFDGTGDDRGLADISKYKITDIVDAYNVTLVLAGHTHLDKKTIYHNHVYLETTSIAAPARTPSGVTGYVPHWGYRIIEIKNNTVKRYAYGEDPFGYMSYPLYLDENGAPASYAATPLFNVTYKFNDLWHYYNVAHLRNNMNQSMLVWVKFVFPKLFNGMNVTVEHSVKTEIYPYNDKTYVYALVNMTPGDTFIRAEVTPTASATRLYSIAYNTQYNESGAYLVVRVDVNDNYGILSVKLYYSYGSTTKVVNMHLEEDYTYIGVSDAINTSTTVTFYIIAVNIFGVNATTQEFNVSISIPPQEGPPISLEVAIILSVVIVFVLAVTVVFFLKRRKIK